MPQHTGMAFVIILHLSPKHQSSADQILQRVTRMPVLQVVNPVPIEPDHVYIIAPSKQLSMVDGHLSLSDLERPRGGHVAIESRPGEGARFTVDLPLIPAEAPTASAAVPTDQSEGALLVLERNPIARSMLRTLLSPHVPVLRFALDVEEALAILAEGRVARLLADEMTLKRAESWPTALDRLVAALPPGDVALLWSRPDPTLREQLNAAGVSRLIEKPVAGAALIAAIVTHPEEKRGREPPDPLVSQAA